MRIILAFALPPLAVLLCGRPLRAVVNVLLTCCFWIPGVVHALVIVYGKQHDEQTARTLRRMEAAIAEHRPAARAALTRRRRWAAVRQVLIGLTLLLVGYVLSAGPAAWLLHEGGLPDGAADLVRLAHRPLDALARHAEWLSRLLDGYRHLWTG